MTYIIRGTHESNVKMSDSRGVYPKKYEVNNHGDGTHGRELSWQFKSKSKKRLRQCWRRMLETNFVVIEFNLLVTEDFYIFL